MIAPELIGGFKQEGRLLMIADQALITTPMHPGRILHARFLKPLKKSQLEVAAALGISRRRVNEIVQGKRNVTADTALRLAKYFQTSASFWLDYQQEWDIYQARSRLGSALHNIPVASQTENL